MEGSKNILNRAYILYGLMVLFGFAVMVKVIQIMFVQGEEWRSKAENLTVSYRTIEAVRGNIYAQGEEDVLLATSVPFYEVRFDPNAEAITDELFDANIDSLSWYLSHLFGDKTPFQYREELVGARNNGKRYHLIKRNVKYTALKEMRDFPIFNRGRYRGGFIYIRQNRRSRPFRSLAQRTIGYDRGNGQAVGLEGAYSKELSGVGGKRLMQKIAGGVWMPVNDENELEPEDGADLYTTIDINIQDVAQSALLKQLRKHDAQYGSVVLMEVATGQIRAIANLKRGEDGRYYENYNFAIGALTDPGSTMKLASYMALLEDGYITPETKVETGDGAYSFYNVVMRDSHDEGYGEITAKEAFAKSSNIAIAKLVEEHYGKDPQKFINRLYGMGLNKPLGVEIAGEGQPYIKSVNDSTWSGISLPWISIGYEVQLTPLQMLAFYNGVANNGKVMKPMFVKSVRRPGEDPVEFKPQVLRERLASEETLDALRDMLETVVTDGTAKNLKHADYSIAGKTGTAQIAKGRLGYDKTSHQASFCGYFPADEPMYSCMVVVNAPSKSVYYGNLVAGPIFKEISDKVYSTSIRLHEEVEQVELADGERPLIPVSKDGFSEDLVEVFEGLDIDYSRGEGKTAWVSTRTTRDSVSMVNRSTPENLMPDVRGMSVEDALYLLENRGLTVTFTGRGAVKQQSVLPGAIIRAGQSVKLELV